MALCHFLGRVSDLRKKGAWRQNSIFFKFECCSDVAGTKSFPAVPHMLEICVWVALPGHFRWFWKKRAVKAPSKYQSEQWRSSTNFQFFEKIKDAAINYTSRAFHRCLISPRQRPASQGGLSPSFLAKFAKCKIGIKSWIFNFLKKKGGCSKAAGTKGFPMVPHMLVLVAGFMHFCRFKLERLHNATPARKELKKNRSSNSALWYH